VIVERLIADGVPTAHGASACCSVRPVLAEQDATQFIESA
jgi:hypothetical protein